MDWFVHLADETRNRLKDNLVELKPTSRADLTYGVTTTYQKATGSIIITISFVKRLKKLFSTYKTKKNFFPFKIEPANKQIFTMALKGLNLDKPFKL